MTTVLGSATAFLLKPALIVAGAWLPGPLMEARRRGPLRARVNDGHIAVRRAAARAMTFHQSPDSEQPPMLCFRNGKTLTLLLVTGSCVAAPAAVTVRSGGPRSIVRLDGLTVIDMVSSVPRPTLSVLIESGRVKAIGARSAVRSPPGTRVVDLTGMYAIPGLIDAHVHVTSPFERRGQQDSLVEFLFRGGITAIRDMAGDARVLRERAEAAKSDSVASPRIFYSAVFASANFMRNDRRVAGIARGLEPGQVPWQRSITSDSDAVGAVRDAKSFGATGIKVYTEITPSQLAAIVRAAHEQGLKVWSHAAVIPAKPMDGVLAGVDVLSHVFMLMFEDVDSVATTYGAGLRQHVVAEHPPNAPSIVRLIAEMKRRGTVLDPSLYVIQRYAASAAVVSGDMSMMRGVDEWDIAVSKLAHQAGVRFVAGTDNSGYPGQNELPTIHDELQLFVERVGMTPFEALEAATRNGAEILGVSNDLGTIALGKLADFVILGANPLADIRNTRRIVAVVKAGRVFRQAR